VRRKLALLGDRIDAVLRDSVGHLVLIAGEAGAAAVRLGLTANES
jgi:hypothetical protein